MLKQRVIFYITKNFKLILRGLMRGWRQYDSFTNQLQHMYTFDMSQRRNFRVFANNMDDEPPSPSTFRYSQSPSLTSPIAITSDQRFRLQHQHFTDDGENDYEYDDDVVQHFNKQNPLLTPPQQQPQYEQLHDKSQNQSNTVSLSTLDRFRQFREQQQQQQQHEQQLQVTLQPPGKRGRKGSEPRKEMVVRLHRNINQIVERKRRALRYLASEIPRSKCEITHH